MEHFLADIWAALCAKEDHPVRAEMEAKTRKAKKTARLRARFEKLKRTHGLG